MPTLTKTLLGSSQDGFVYVSKTGFNSAAVSNYLVNATKDDAGATPGIYAATFRQGASSNTYADWGVPSGAVVTGIRLVTASGVLVEAGTGSASVQLWTDEADLGLFDISNISGGTLATISKVASDYVRVQIDISATIDFDPGEGYGTLSVDVSDIEIEVTYSNPDAPFSDSAAQSDAVSVSGRVTVAESVTVSESQSVSGSASHTESVNVSEGQSLSGTNPYAESATLSEALAVSGTVQRSESSQMSENIANFDITGGDLEGLSEGVGLGEDVQIVGISYQLEDGVQCGDAQAMQGVVTVNDSARMSEGLSFTATLVTQTDTFVDAIQDSNYL